MYSERKAAASVDLCTIIKPEPTLLNCSRVRCAFAACLSNSSWGGCRSRRMCSKWLVSVQQLGVSFPPERRTGNHDSWLILLLLLTREQDRIKVSPLPGQIDFSCSQCRKTHAVQCVWKMSSSWKDGANLPKCLDGKLLFLTGFMYHCGDSHFLFRAHSLLLGTRAQFSSFCLR